MNYPDLSSAKMLCIDIETYDPELKEKGNGVFRRDGYLLGVAVSDGTFSEYYNILHKGISYEEQTNNIEYLKSVLALPVPKLGTNVLYDIDWLQNFAGFTVNGQWHDIIVAESLIDEYRYSYSLESLANDYLGEHKENRELFNWCLANGFKVSKLGDERKWLWKMPYEMVRPYAIGDVELPLRIFEKQQTFLTKVHKFKRNGVWEPQTLESIYDLEIRSQPMLLSMRKNGVRIDKENLIYTGIQCKDIIDKLDEELQALSGNKYFNTQSSKDLESLFVKNNMPIIRNEPTENMVKQGKTIGNPCFNKDVLTALEDKYPVVGKVLERRHYGTIMSFFINKYPKLLVGDRLHCNFHPTKRDEGGTVTGRFSSSDPNLQQVSGKKEDNENQFLRGKIIRKLFIPEEGMLWLKNDWSQIEYRIIAHYAIGEGALEIRKQYNSDPTTDYHLMTGKMSGLIVDPDDDDQRRITKTLNFGTAYGMGPNTMSSKYAWDIEYAHMIYNEYHKKLPFVRTTSRSVEQMAAQRGYIKTLLGRHCHMPSSNKSYVMFNRLIQGSAADIMKAAMVQAYESGLFKPSVLVPHLTVHDELDCSMAVTKEGIEAAIELKHIMETCVELKVPIKCDSEIGPNWGEVKDFDKWRANEHK